MQVATDDLLTRENWTKILNSKKKSSAPGEDKVTYELLRCLKPGVTEKIIEDINGMWRRGTISDSLKSIKVVAIPKPGRDQNLPTGKRPISLVPTLAKVANTAVLHRLQDFLEDHKVLPNTTFGFRRQLSTTTCVSFVVNWIKESKREKFITAMVCIDLSNAFNAVQIEKLEEVLSTIGVSGDIQSWITSFLTNRKISLQLRDQTISRRISNGLPQGDVLSPTLFNVYTLDLHKFQEEDGVLVQYADDFGLLIRAKTLEKLKETGQRVVDKFVETATALNFEINPDKTKAILFMNNDKTLDLKIDGKTIETVRYHKYLGVTIDRFLSFGIHIKEVRNKIQDRMNMVKVLNGVRNGTHPEVMLKVYKAIFQSVMEYGCSVYNNARPTNRKILSVINNQCLRRVTGATKTTPLNALAGLSGQGPLDIRHQYVASREVARCFHTGNIVMEQLRKVRLPEDCEQWSKFTYMERLYWSNKQIFDNIDPLVKCRTEEVEIFDRLEGLEIAKDESNPFRLRQLALFVMNGRDKHLGKIYTDASKEGRTCGIGVYVEASKQRISAKLGNETCITSAELEAIGVAAKIIEGRQQKGTVIYTDSQSACVILQLAQESGEAAQNIANILDTCRRWAVRIQWIPSHVNIQGNEIADRLAKGGLTTTNVINNSLQLKDAMLLLKKQMDRRNSDWYEMYSEDKGKAFFTVQPVFADKPWYTGSSFKGKEVRLLNRLITGHDYAKYWLEKMKIVEDSTCEICQTAETSEHLIMDCPRYELARSKLSFETQNVTLTDVFKLGNWSTYQEIVDFVKTTKLSF